MVKCSRKGRVSMISFIKGTVEHVFGSSVVLAANGVGYEVHVSPATISKLPSGAGEPCKLFTHMQVSEDAIALYGFLTLEELQTFGLLLKVSGVGAKLALSLLASLSPQRIMIAILSDDAGELSKAPGVGKKMAARISLELRDRIKSRDDVFAGNGPDRSMMSGGSAERGDAVDALVALGYGKTDAVRAVAEAAEGMTVEQMIKMGLRKLAGR